MANSKQSEKRARQNSSRRLRGQNVRTRCRTMIKKARAAASSNAEAFAAAYLAMQSAIDRAVTKGILRKNTVSRIKQRINRLRPQA